MQKVIKRVLGVTAGVYSIEVPLTAYKFHFDLDQYGNMSLWTPVKSFGTRTKALAVVIAHTEMEVPAGMELVGTIVKYGYEYHCWVGDK